MKLEQASFTAGMPNEQLARLSALGQKIRLKEDQVIVPAGKRSTHFYVLLSGSVSVEVRTPVYVICVQLLRRGEAFGWSSLLDRHNNLFQVRTKENCTAIRWDGELLSAECRQHPELGSDFFYRVLGLAAGRVKATEAKLAEFCGAAAE